MKRRTAGIVIGLLIGVCLVLVLTIAYPFSTSEPHAANAEQFTGVAGTEYHISGAITSDGDEYMVFEGIAVEGGERYESLTVRGVQSESYQAAPGEVVYTRSEYPDEIETDQILERIDDREDQHVLRVDRDGENVVFFTRDEDGGDLESSITSTAPVIVGSVRNTEYERVQESDEEYVYEPKNGWFDGQDGYRITDSTGQVRVDPDSYTATAAEVSFTVTPGAGTYAEYLYTTWATDDTFTREVSYEYTSENVTVEPPEWVESLQNAE